MNEQVIQTIVLRDVIRSKFRRDVHLCAYSKNLEGKYVDNKTQRIRSRICLNQSIRFCDWMVIKYVISSVTRQSHIWTLLCVPVRNIMKCSIGHWLTKSYKGTTTNRGDIVIEPSKLAIDIKKIENVLGIGEYYITFKAHLAPLLMWKHSTTLPLIPNPRTLFDSL